MIDRPRHPTSASAAFVSGLLPTLDGLRALVRSGEGEGPDDRESVLRYGRALWDVFSNNNRVVDPRGVSFDLGSFRGSSGEIAALLESAYPMVGGFDSLDFYMGGLGESAAAARDAYRDIFERIRTAGCDWIPDVPPALLDRPPVVVEYLAVFEKPSCPIPGLDPAPIDFDAYRAFTPEKLELFRGYLIDGEEDARARLELLSILLRNVGLRTAVRLAPAAVWREAIDTWDG